MKRKRLPCPDCGGMRTETADRCMRCEYAHRRAGRAERFWAKVDRTGGPDACWPWLASTSAEGYGRFSSPDAPKGWEFAHRVAYTLLVGPIPDGAVLDHQCHNQDGSCEGGRACGHRRCVNPAHVDPVANRVNVLRSRHGAGGLARRTHCNRGHAYTPENTYRRRKRTGWYRCCRRCHADQMTASRHARAAA